MEDKIMGANNLFPQIQLVVKHGIFVKTPVTTIPFAEIERQEKITLESIAALMISKSDMETKLEREMTTVTPILEEQQKIEQLMTSQPLIKSDEKRLKKLQKQTSIYRSSIAFAELNIALLVHLIERKLQFLNELNFRKPAHARLSSFEIQEKITLQMINTALKLKGENEQTQNKLNQILKSQLFELENLLSLRKKRPLSDKEIARMEFLTKQKDTAEYLQVQDDFYDRFINQHITQLSLIRDKLFASQQQETGLNQDQAESSRSTYEVIVSSPGNATTQSTTLRSRR